jgi:hypothetical protein
LFRKLSHLSADSEGILAPALIVSMPCAPNCVAAGFEDCHGCERRVFLNDAPI